MEKLTRSTLSTMFVHPSDANLLKPVRLMLESLEEKKFGDVSYFETEQDFFDSLKVEGEVVVICSGRLHYDGNWLKAGEFAKLVKDKNPKAIVIAYSNSDEPMMNPGSLDAYIQRGLQNEMYYDFMGKALLSLSLKGLFGGQYFSDAYLSNFINEIGDISDRNGISALVEKYEGKCFQQETVSNS